MEKPFLSGNLKLDEASLKRIFIYNLNQVYPVLLHLADSLPILAKSIFYGDLHNAAEELLSEVKVQLDRVDAIFVHLKEVPKNSNTPNDKIQFLTFDNEDELLDGLSKDLALVFYLQKIIAVKKNYFHILKSIGNSLNDINIKQYLQYSCDECEENQMIFRLIAKEYMESTINKFLQ